MPTRPQRMTSAPALLGLLLALLLAAIVRPGAADAAARRKRKPARRPPPEQRHFDVSSSVWSGKVDAAEVLQGTLALRVDALGHGVRGSITGRDGNGLVQCAGSGTLRAGALELACKGDGLEGTLHGALTAAKVTLRFAGAVRGRPIDGEIDVVRGRSRR